MLLLEGVQGITVIITRGEETRTFHYPAAVQAEVIESAALLLLRSQDGALVAAQPWGIVDAVRAMEDQRA